MSMAVFQHNCITKMAGGHRLPTLNLEKKWSFRETDEVALTLWMGSQHIIKRQGVISSHIAISERTKEGSRNEAQREVRWYRSDQIRSVAQSCLTLCNPMNCSTPGLPVHHQLPEFTQTHVHRVSDAISSSVVPFSSCPQSLPASGSLPMSQLFAWGGQSTRVSALASQLWSIPTWATGNWLPCALLVMS